MTGLAAIALATLSGAPFARAAQPLAKTCGPNNQYLIGFRSTMKCSCW
jgi:hypothetical protein